MVVSMRPIPGGLVGDAAVISGRMPAVHGAPVHVGDPDGLGIVDLDRPDFGAPVRFRRGDDTLVVDGIPGVTPFNTKPIPCS